MPSDNEICQMEAVELAGRVRAKEVSPVEVVDAVLDRMDRLELTLHAFCTPTPELAREEARRLEREISEGQDAGQLAGVPIGIKDLRATKGIRTSIRSMRTSGMLLCTSREPFLDHDNKLSASNLLSVSETTSR
jgi:aspartyl-tRNA(Asn)/glutamyl-tRNA(Gln) amidotransferase subunit A